MADDTGVKESMLSQKGKKDKIVQHPSVSRSLLAGYGSSYSVDITGVQIEPLPKRRVSYVPGGKNDPHRTYRLLKQAILTCGFLNLGMFVEILGPTLPDLKQRLGVSYQEISPAMSAWGGGYLVGVVLGGLLNTRFSKHTDVMITAGFWTAAVVTVAIPFATYVPLLGILVVMNALCDGFIASGCNTTVMEMWGTYATGPLVTMFFGYSVGALIAPQIAQPFLSQQQQPLANTSDILNCTDCPDLWGDSNIEIAYAIIAACSLLMGVLMLFFHFKTPEAMATITKLEQEPNKGDGTMKAAVRTCVCGTGSPAYNIGLLVLLVLYFFQAFGGQNIVTRLLFAFAIESEAGWTKSEASSLMTVFWACFATGRLVGIPLARYLPIWLILLCDLSVILTSAIFMMIYAYSNKVALWATTVLFGFFTSLTFPVGLGWANVYLKTNHLTVMLLLAGGGAGAMFYQNIAGQLLEIQCENMPLAIVICQAIMLGVAIAMHVVIWTCTDQRRSSEKEGSVKE